MMPSFDREAAKRAGYSDEEIDAFLSGAPAPGAASSRVQPDWRAQALGTLPPTLAVLGGVLGGMAGLPEGGIGAVPGGLIGASAGGMTGRNLEQMGLRLLGLPEAQANVLGVPIPQALDLPATGLGYASGEALGLAGAAGVQGIAKGLRDPATRSALWQGTKATGRFIGDMLPGGGARAVRAAGSALERISVPVAAPAEGTAARTAGTAVKRTAEVMERIAKNLVRKSELVGDELDLVTKVTPGRGRMIRLENAQGRPMAVVRAPRGGDTKQIAKQMLRQIEERGAAKPAAAAKPAVGSAASRVRSQGQRGASTPELERRTAARASAIGGEPAMGGAEMGSQLAGSIEAEQAMQRAGFTDAERAIGRRLLARGVPIEEILGIR